MNFPLILRWSGLRKIKKKRKHLTTKIRKKCKPKIDHPIDPVSGESMTVSTPSILTEYYHEELSRLQEELKSKIWSYTTVDACLHIGMYKEEGIAMASFAIEHILKEQTKNYIIIDWLSITDNLSEPIFAKPFPPEFIVDVLTGQIKIIIGLNLDVLIELFDSFGLKTRWLSEKETNKEKQRAPRKGMVIINKRGIGITLPSGQESIVYGGIISKILYDSIRPSNVALTYFSMDIKIEE